MARRRTQHYGASVIPAAAATAGTGSWIHFREPGHVGGLVALIITAFVVLPFCVIALGYLWYLVRSHVPPREWRGRFRVWRTHTDSVFYAPRAKQRSARIPVWLARLVHYIDRYQCTACGAVQGAPTGRYKKRQPELVVLHTDHRIPWIVGGLTSFWNLATLCQDCNLAKSYYFVRANGTVAYRRGASQAAIDRAAAITDAERRRCISPLRLVRTAYSLGWI